MKMCKTCGVEKPAEEYRVKSGVCKPCLRVANAARMKARRATPEGAAKAREAVRRWKNANPDKVFNHRERVAVRNGREGYGLRAGLDRDVRLRANEMRRRARLAERQQSPTRGMTPAERYRWRMANDPAFVINMRMRTAIKKALRGAKGGRRWETLVGYRLVDLVAHLERQMPKGYTLDDLGSGRIHIDHIVPKSAFDVTKDEGLRAAWALPNLRPVLAEVNLTKSARREFLL